MKVLVAIANHGTKNRRFLDRLLASYRGMSYDVDLVVLSDEPKDLGDDVEVLVGAPIDDPWSLPFAHRPLFAARADAYDLFIYSEDDTLIEERHIEAFLEVDELLPDDEIPGFMRFEEYPGRRWYCSIHSSYRWDPTSVSTCGGEVFASYSNEHSACYILTRSQLHRAIASGGFLIEPHKGEYDMLVSAATDPYTRCGLRRRLCISRVDDFLLHHLPNVYLDKLGVDERTFRSQMRGLMRLGSGELSADQLVDPVSNLPTPVWDVDQHPKMSPELRALVPPGTEHVLSFGAVGGAFERELFGSHATIVAVPLDEIVGEVARTHGLRTTAPDLRSAMDELAGERFDVVLAHQILHHVEEPGSLLRQLAQQLRPSGRIVVVVPNVRHHRLRARLGRDAPPVPGRAGFSHDQVHATDPRVLRGWARTAGLAIDEIRLDRPRRLQALGRWSPSIADRWTGRTIAATLRPRGR